MKTFIFRLERLLRLHSTRERERARALGQAIRDEQARREALEQAAVRLGRCGEQVAGSAGQVSAAGTLRNLGLAVEAAANQVEAAEISHRSAIDSLQAQQELFGTARRERRVVERLREKRQADWAQEASQQEQKEHDGLAIHRRSTRERTP